MKLTDYFTLSFGSLSARRTRSILTILMVVIGASLMTALNGMNAGFGEFINEQISTLGANVLIVSRAPFIGSRFGPSSGQTSQLTINDLTVRTIAPLEGVGKVVPYYMGGGSAISEGHILSVTVFGLEPDRLHFVVPSLTLEEGEYPMGSDQTAVLVGSGIAYPESLTKRFVDVNRPLKIEYSIIRETVGGQRVDKSDRVFIVKGILKPTGNPLIDESIYLSPSVANVMFEKEGKYDGMYVVTVDEDLNEAVESEIKKIYRENISVTSQKAILAVIRDLISGFNTFILAIAGVSMLVGAVGIVTTLYTSVMERTREIGIFKALGFTNYNIMSLFLSESVTIGILGGTLGLGGGAVLANILIRAAQYVNPQAPLVAPVIKPEDVLLVWFLSVILSCIAGLYPAWRAAKLTPVEALRRE